MKFKSTKQFVSYLFESGYDVADLGHKQQLTKIKTALDHDYRPQEYEVTYSVMTYTDQDLERFKKMSLFDMEKQFRKVQDYQREKVEIETPNKIPIDDFVRQLFMILNQKRAQEQMILNQKRAQEQKVEADQNRKVAEQFLNKIREELNTRMGQLESDDFDAEDKKIINDRIQELRAEFPQIKALMQEIEKANSVLNDPKTPPIRKVDAKQELKKLKLKLEAIKNEDLIGKREANEKLAESKFRKQFLNYLFEADQTNKTDDILDFLNGKLEGEKLYIDDEIMEKLNSLKGVQLTKALEWFYEKPVTMTYGKDIINKHEGSSSITNYIKNLMRKQNMEVPEELNESYFDLKHWQKMARIKVLKS